MTASEASKIRVGDRLEYPAGWPKQGPQALVEPCEVFGLRDCPFSESHRILYFHSADGKRTIELDASWFKPPKRLLENSDIVSNEVPPVPRDEWDF